MRLELLPRKRRSKYSPLRRNDSDPAHNEAVLRQGCTYEVSSSAYKLILQSGALHYYVLWRVARDFLWV